MGSFYANACVRGVDASAVVAWLRLNKQEGFVGPTVNGWTCFVTEFLDSQETVVIERYGQLITNTGATAVFVRNADDAVLSFVLFQDGEEIAEFDSAPGICMVDATEDDLKPLLIAAEAFAKVMGTDEATLAGLLPEPANINLEPARKLHARWVRVLGLPEYSVGVSFRSVTRAVKRDKGPVAWVKV